MKPAKVVFFLTCMVLVASAALPAAVQRLALVAGANDGGPDRPLLKYAVSDAERFARVLLDLGGVSPANAVLLKQPKLRELEQALDQLRSRIDEARRTAAGNGGGRTEVLVYYSGHADDKGLLLGEDRYSYRSLRDRLDDVAADVRIAVLDACASGAITRIKGGVLRPPFLVDESADMRGHAFLTSSTETEAAQESDRIRGSYFTHFLISGLRGAADMSGEGKVTLNEAYQFAFNETLGRTTEAKGGAQHPSYDINLSGTGDVVMTDLRQTSATLVLGEALDGRFFVSNARQELIVELYKPYGRKVELGVEAGSYEVRVEREAAALLAKPKLGEGDRVVLEPTQFTPTTLLPTRARGGFVPPRFAVTDRNRIELLMGTWFVPGRSDTPSVAAGEDAVDIATGLVYTRFLRENLALTFGARVRASHSTIVSPSGSFAGDLALVSLPLGVRWNPMTDALHTRAVRPYLAVGLGPVFGGSSGAGVWVDDGAFAGSRTRASVGGTIDAGVDFLLGRHWSLGVGGGYQWMVDFSEPVGALDNYSGFQVGVSIGWLFGKGSAPRE